MQRMCVHDTLDIRALAVDLGVDGHLVMQRPRPAELASIAIDFCQIRRGDFLQTEACRFHDNAITTCQAGADVPKVKMLMTLVVQDVTCCRNQNAEVGGTHPASLPKRSAAQST